MMRILIVDDKEEHLHFLHTLLTGEGYIVESAQHGEEALFMARQTPPEVIVSDLLMPVMDGYTLLRHWKGDTRLSQVPFIVYTAIYTEPEDEQLALSLGADAFILKPAGPDDFLARLREVHAAGPATSATLPPGMVSDEMMMLKGYSQTLVRKLERKTMQLQEANRALQEDIAARQRTEAALRASEAQFASSFVHAAIGMALLSPAGRYVKVNRALCEMFGYSEAELLVRNYFDITHPEDIDDRGERRRLLAGEIDKFALEKRYLHRDGHIVWGCLSVSLLRDEAGQPLHVVAQVQNITERKQSEEATRRALQRLNDAQCIAQIGDWEWLPNSQSISWSPQVFEIFGRDPRLGPPRDYEEYAAIYDEENRALLKASVTAAVTSGVIQAHELTCCRRDGSRIYVRGVIVPSTNESGRVHLHGTIQDITASREIEAALRRSEALFRTLVQTSWDGFHLIDQTGRITYESPAVSRVLGYTPEEMIGRNVLDFIHPHEVAGDLAGGEKIAQPPDQLRHLTERVRHQDGSWRWIESYDINLIDHPDVGAIAVNYRDITERKRAEAALRESEAELRNLAEAMPQMVWITTPDGQNTYSNQQWLDYTGLTPEQSVGFGWNTALHPDDQERGRIAWEEATRITGTYSVEYRIRRADGVYRWWLDRGVPQCDAAGKIVKWFGTCTDIHDLKEADFKIHSLNADLEQRVAQRTAELFAVTQEAEKANRAKSDFLSRTSHELRTPLNAILGFGQLLEVEGRDPEEADSIEQILRAGRHLLELINEMLDLSRIEAGQLELSLTPESLHETVGEALALVRPMATDRGVTLDRFESSAYVMVDRQRFKQVVLNLLSNAVKYNHPGGRVTCSAGPPSEGRLRLAVTDTGIGIAAADAGKVFTAFERFGAAATNVEGIGLGLAITRQLTELMGGHIGFDSVPGEGSTFWVDLPVAEKALAPEAGAEVSAPRAPGTPADSRKLLYIEDNVSNLRLFTRIVARRPAVEFLSAANGTLGLEMARVQHPDMILLDLHLPDLDGTEVLRRLQADPATAQIPVIVLTADAVPGRREQSLVAGARAFLTKPLEIRTVLALIDQYLG